MVFIGEKEYYERQFATLKSFEDVDSLVASDGIEEDDLEEQAQHERAMKIFYLYMFDVLSRYLLYYVSQI